METLHSSANAQDDRIQSMHHYRSEGTKYLKNLPVVAGNTEAKNREHSRVGDLSSFSGRTQDVGTTLVVKDNK